MKVSLSPYNLYDKVCQECETVQWCTASDTPALIAHDVTENIIKSGAKHQ